ncbi:MAG: sensor histidine kinase [Taibaiella sp.]|nr:sensor histidine kinase [Taibaiella sp.]
MLYRILAILVMFASPGFVCYASESDSLAVFNRLDSTFKFVYENDIAQALQIIERQEKISDMLHEDSLTLKVAYNRGDVLLVQGFHDMAAEYYYKVLRIAEKIGHAKYEAQVNYNICNVFTQKGDYASAEKHIRRAYEVAVAGKVYDDTITFNYALGEVWAYTDRLEAGLALVKSNVEGAKLKKDYDNVVVGLDMLSYIYFENDQAGLAVRCLREALPYLEQIESNYRRAVIYQHISEAYLVAGKWDSASYFLEPAFKYARIINSPDWLYECYKDEASILAHQGRYKEALTAHHQYGKYKDTVLQKDYNNKIAALSSGYALEKKQAKIELLQKDNDLRATKIREQKMERNGIVLGSTLSLVLVIAFYRGRMSRKTRHLQRMFSQSLLRNQEADKQRIAQELHDSIGQNILFIKNQVSAQPDDERKEQLIGAITETIDEVRNISKELYPNQLEKYGLAAAVDTLAEKTAEATGTFVSSDLQEIDQKLTRDAKINLYRIIQESIANAVKHAQAKAIRITGEIQKSRIVLTVIDNGRGFDVSKIAQKAQSSFGLLGIEERARLLDGKMQLESTPAGTRLSISIPIQANGL